MAISLPLVKAGLFREGIIAQDVFLPVPPQAGSPPHCSLPPYMGHHVGKKSLFETWVFIRLLVGRVSPNLELQPALLPHPQTPNNRLFLVVRDLLPWLTHS